MNAGSARGGLLRILSRGCTPFMAGWFDLEKDVIIEELQQANSDEENMQ